MAPCTYPSTTYRYIHNTYSHVHIHIHIYQYVYTYRYVYAPPHVSLNNLAHVVRLDQLVNKHLGEARPQRRGQILLAHVRRRVHARK